MRSLHTCLLSKSSFTLAIVFLLLSTLPAISQDSPGRFELGGSFTAFHQRGRSALGPALEGGFNFGQHFALDAQFSWFPGNQIGSKAMMGLFGVKAGTRTEHFGFFGKARPGFMTRDNVLREETLLVTPGIGGFPQVFDTGFRFSRLTEPALDLGGVVEYYPSRHWVFRWDMGDTLIFRERGPRTIILGTPPPLGGSFVQSPGKTTHQFQFNSGIHFRF